MLHTEATAGVGDDAVCVETDKGKFEFPDKNGVWAAVKSATTATQ
jgi:hypothetical protein